MPYAPSAEAQRHIQQILNLKSGSGGPSLPTHIAVIMDGNGRWAKERGLPRIEGHKAGIEAVRLTARACRKLEIPYLTLYAFSTENWKRPRSEVAALMRLLRRFLKEEIPEMVENEIRLQTIGDVRKLPLYVQNQMARTKKRTSNGKMMQLTLALSYGSRAEITGAVKTIARKIQKAELKAKDIDDELIARHLYTSEMPDPDLLIRTSGEHRISNFLLWQIAYAEIHITDVPWPNFTDIDFYQAVLDYLGRDRRFGAVKEVF